MTRTGTADEAAAETPPAAADGSRLCLACGLCCQGALHDHVVLAAAEVEPARRLGLAVRAEGDGWAFEVPCPRHRQNRCTVYDRRPSPCRSYRCKLLRRFLAGEVGLEASLGLVEEVRRRIADLRRRIGGGGGKTIWQQLRNVLPAASSGRGAPGVDRELLLEVAVLQSLCRRHFKNRARPVRGSPARGSPVGGSPMAPE